MGGKTGREREREIEQSTSEMATHARRERERERERGREGGTEGERERERERERVVSLEHAFPCSPSENAPFRQGYGTSFGPHSSTGIVRMLASKLA